MKLMKNLIVGLLLSALVSLLAIAGSMSDTYENKTVDVLFRGQALSESSPANHYVELYTTSCSDSARGTEVSGAGYARVAIARSATAWKGTHGTASGASSGTSGTISNAAIVQFGAPTANWGTVTAFGISDASSGGNMIVCNNLTASKNINNGDAAPSFAIDALTVQIDN